MQTVVLPLQPMQMRLTHPPERHLKRCRPQSRALIPQPYLTTAPPAVSEDNDAAVRHRCAYRCDSGKVPEQARSARPRHGGGGGRCRYCRARDGDLRRGTGCGDRHWPPLKPLLSRAAEAEAIALLAREGSGATNEEGGNREATTTEVASGSDRVVAQTASADAPTALPMAMHSSPLPQRATRQLRGWWTASNGAWHTLRTWRLGARRRGRSMDDCGPLAALRLHAPADRAPARSSLSISEQTERLGRQVATWEATGRRAAGSARGMRRLTGTTMPAWTGASSATSERRRQRR